MSITESSNATTAAPAVDQPAAEAAKNVEEKSTVQEPSKETDKVSKQKNIKRHDVVNHVFGSWSMIIDNDGSNLVVHYLIVNDLV